MTKPMNELITTAEAVLIYQTKVHLANKRGTVPAKIADEEAEELLRSGEVDERYSYMITPIESFENGKPVNSVAIAFIDKETGYHYNSQLIK